MPRREERDALRRYAEDEELPEVLREIARLAIARGFTQESLAKELGTNSGGVHRHFKTRSPREGTLRDYARALRVPAEYLLLLRNPRFQDSRSEQKWVNNIGLRYQSNAYAPEASGGIKEAVLALPERARFNCLKAAALAWYRAEHLVPAIPEIEAHSAFERAAVAEGIDVSQYRSDRAPGEERFVKLWDAVGDLLDVSEFDVLLAVVRALHLKRGIDTTPMDAALERDTLYHDWREGRYEREVI